MTSNMQYNYLDTTVDHINDCRSNSNLDTIAQITAYGMRLAYNHVSLQ